jgi:hypothetical protein
VIIVMSFADGTEVWYEADQVTVCPNPLGVAAVSHLAVPGVPERPDGPYVEIRNATVARVAGVGA